MPDVIEIVRSGGWRDRNGPLAGRIVAAILACALWLPAAVPLGARAAVALPAAANFATDGSAAGERRVPILLFFNRVGCPYCERALREYLWPMQRDSAYAGRVVFRQIEIDKLKPLVDFAGAATSHRDFAARYKIRLTPTIWFVDGAGNTLAEPIVGLPTLDFFGAYLDQRINDSLVKLRASQ